MFLVSSSHKLECFTNLRGLENHRFWSEIACIAGSMVDAWNKVLAAEPLIVSGKVTRNTACQRTWVFFNAAHFYHVIDSTDPS